MWDFHKYQTRAFLVDGFNFFDAWQQRGNNTKVTVFCGEYSTHHTDAEVRLTYPLLISTTAEAVYHLGAERNPNVVKLPSYAPSLANFNFAFWTRNLLNFNVNLADKVFSMSYYQEKMFNQYHGTEIVEVVNTAGDIFPLCWAASSEDD